MAQAKPYRAAC